jgi:hypothetical protein
MILKTLIAIQEGALSIIVVVMVAELTAALEVEEEHVDVGEEPVEEEEMDVVAVAVVEEEVELPC